MKKSILSIFAIAMVAILGLTSCDKQKTQEAFLTREKGWTLDVAECPGGLVMDNDATITNLFDGYVWDCEKDDVIKFNADGYEYLNPGTELCEDQASREQPIGKWALDVDGEVLDMQIPFFYDEEVESCTLLNLVKDELKVQYVYTQTDGPAKTKPGTYTFILTYVPAK